MWTKLRRKGQPEMLDDFEQFLASVASEMRRTKDESITLEQALKARYCRSDALHSIQQLPPQNSDT